MTTFERLRAIIVEQLGIGADKVTPEARFDDDLGADSLDRLEVVMEVEEQFGVEIDDAMDPAIETVGGAVAFIDRLLAGKVAA